jgi:hypothetical protein
MSNTDMTTPYNVHGSVFVKARVAGLFWLGTILT